MNYVSIPQEKADESMAASGFPAWLVKLISELNTIGKAGYLAEVKPDVEEVLKRKPITFSKFLADHLQVFKQKS